MGFLVKRGKIFPPELMKKKFFFLSVLIIFTIPIPASPIIYLPGSK